MGGGGIPSTMAYTGRLRLKGVPFFRLQVCYRVGILLVEVCESVRLSVISVRKKAQKGLQSNSKAVKSRENVLVL